MDIVGTTMSGYTDYTSKKIVITDFRYEEIEIEETPEEWVRKKFKNEKELRLERVEKEDGTLVIDVMTAMIHQRYTISEI